MSERKAPGQRVRTSTLDIGIVSIAPSTEPPPPPPRLLEATQRAWRALWASPLASVVQFDADRQPLERLFTLYDERARLLHVLTGGGQRLVAGARGEPRLSPLYAGIGHLDAEIRLIEDRFGLSPKARLRLGIILGAAVRSLADLAKFDDEGDAPDARLAAGVPTEEEK